MITSNKWRRGVTWRRCISICHVRQSRHELFVNWQLRPDPHDVRPGLIIVPRAIAEGAQNAFEIVLVLQAERAPLRV